MIFRASLIFFKNPNTIIQINISEMNRAQLIDRISKNVGIPKVYTKDVVNGLFTVISEACMAGDTVQIYDFGKFHMSRRKGFVGINPKTGARIEVPESSKLTFTASKKTKRIAGKES